MATVTVSNPFYKRLKGAHPVLDSAGQPIRPKIGIEILLAALLLRRQGGSTGLADDAAVSAFIGENSGRVDPDGVFVPGTLDTIETAQFNDLLATITQGSTAANKADRGDQLHKIRVVLNVLEMGGTQPSGAPRLNADGAAFVLGFDSDDMAGTTTVAGGKLGVIRRDATYP